jgi:beta-lactamase superfamily II metal-dependent hydrolase
MEIHVFNIGQADSMLVIGPPPARKTLLVDLGEPTGNSKLPPNFTSSTEVVRQRIRELTGGDRVDYFVLTHYHSDHAGFAPTNAAPGTGIIQVLSDSKNPFRVGEFIHVQDDGSQFMGSGAKDRPVFKRIRQRMPGWIKAGRVGSSTKPTFGKAQIDLGSGVSVDILAFAGTVPGGASAFHRAEIAGANYAVNPGDENDLSIALEITAGEFEMFAAGDLNGASDPVNHPLFVLREFGSIFTNIESQLVDQWTSVNRESDVEIYRADHHGSGFSSTVKLVDALDPEFILYSTGADSQHPSDDVVKRGRKTARQFATTAVIHPSTFTSARGKVTGEIDIVVAPDGKSYTIEGEKHLAFTDAEERAGKDVGEETRHH